jgi:hypothetical protein
VTGGRYYQRMMSLARKDSLAKRGGSLHALSEAADRTPGPSIRPSGAPQYAHAREAPAQTGGAFLKVPR